MEWWDSFKQRCLHPGIEEINQTVKIKSYYSQPFFVWNHGIVLNKDVCTLEQSLNVFCSIFLIFWYHVQKRVKVEWYHLVTLCFQSKTKFYEVSSVLKVEKNISEIIPNMFVTSSRKFKFSRITVISTSTQNLVKHLFFLMVSLLFISFALFSRASQKFGNIFSNMWHNLAVPDVLATEVMKLTNHLDTEMPSSPDNLQELLAGFAFVVWCTT